MNVVILAIVVSFVAVVALVLGGRGLINQITLKNRIIGKKIIAQQQLDKNIKAVKKLASQYDDLGQVKVTLADALPSTSDFPSLSGLMENIAKVSGISLKSVSSTVSSAAPVSGVATSVSDTGLKVFNFNIEVSGSYGSLLVLFKNLELSARPMRITLVGVDGNSQGLDVKLAITTYFQAPASLTTKTEVVK